MKGVELKPLLATALPFSHQWRDGPHSHLLLVQSPGHLGFYSTQSYLFVSHKVLTSQCFEHLGYHP
ncbi:MAG: hypothetical protein ACK56F_01190, partial [bacterium]